jgi:BTB/POZ domain
MAGLPSNTPPSQESPRISRFVVSNSVDCLLTLLSYVKSKIIKVFVGKERILYNLHKTLLCDECPFFERCLNSGFKESRTGEVILTEDSVKAFDRFVEWVYNHKLHAEDENFPLAETYTLADKSGMEALKNVIVDAAIKANISLGTVANRVLDLPL